MIARLTSGGGSAGGVISTASGENSSGESSGPSVPVIGAVLVAAYVGYQTIMG
jgi:hypothetical protein